MVAIALPVFGMKLDLPANDRMPQVQTIQTYNDMVRAFPNLGTPFFVAVRNDGANPAQVTSALTALETRAMRDPLLAGKSTPAVRTSADGKILKVTFGTPYAVDSPQAMQLLNTLDQQLVPSTLGKVAGVDYAVGGPLAMNVSANQHLSQVLPLVLGFLSC